jgi:hypothetical protein
MKLHNPEFKLREVPLLISFISINIFLITGLYMVFNNLYVAIMFELLIYFYMYANYMVHHFIHYSFINKLFKNKINDKIVYISELEAKHLGITEGYFYSYSIKLIEKDIKNNR